MINQWDNEICIIRLAEINNTMNGQRRFLSARSEYDHRWQGEKKIGKRSTHSLKIRSASKRKESELIKIDCWWPPPSLQKIKNQNKTKTIGKRTLLFEGVQGRGGGTQARLWRFFSFTLNFFLMRFFSRYFLDSEWSTMIYEHFEQDKHQFVWPNVLAKRPVTEKRTILSSSVPDFSFSLFQVLTRATFSPKCPLSVHLL